MPSPARRPRQLVSNASIYKEDTVPAAQQPVLKREGNLRFAGIPAPGYPRDPITLASEVRQLLAGAGATFIGPPLIWFTVPPYGGPHEWECQVGWGITGLPKPAGRVLIEDYARLYAVTAPHAGPISELGTTHQRLSDHGRSLGYLVRPYWRLALWHRRLADGNPLPSAEVSVFLDR
jgi:hypothetical protein